jgi:hypothetical protein
MKIFGEVEILEPYPAVYIPSVDSIVIAELHLGYEEAMVEQGLFLPKVQLKKEQEMLEKILEKRGARRIIVNGDFKHEFSRGSYREYKEVAEMLDFLGRRFQEVKLVKGNHDNFLIYPARRYGAELFEEYEVGDYYFLHGHRVPLNFESVEAGNIVIAHEHPAVAFHDEIGVKERLPCFLFGRTRDERNILVLPAFSPLSQGSEVNMLPVGELLSPLLKRYVDVDELEVIGISEAVGVLKFSKLRSLRFL